MGGVKDRIQIVEARPRIHGPRVGAIRSISVQGRPVVDFPGNPLGPQPARAAASIPESRLKAWQRDAVAVLLVFEDSDASLPVIVDAVAEPRPGSRRLRRPAPEAEPSTDAPVSAAGTLQASVGTLVGVKDGLALVRDASGETRRARTAVALRNLKDPVFLVEAGVAGPVIIGQLFPDIAGAPGVGTGAELVLKAERVTIEADVELLLRAGTTTVRLESKGKASTTAEQVVSTARGANKIRGGSVQLN